MPRKRKRRPLSPFRHNPEKVSSLGARANESTGNRAADEPAEDRNAALLIRLGARRPARSAVHRVDRDARPRAAHLTAHRWETALARARSRRRRPAVACSARADLTRTAGVAGGAAVHRIGIKINAGRRCVRAYANGWRGAASAGGAALAHASQARLAGHASDARPAAVRLVRGEVDA